MANYCFMIGGGLLFIAVILIIYKYIKLKVWSLFSIAEPASTF
jgi:hypothetical protein